MYIYGAPAIAVAQAEGRMGHLEMFDEHTSTWLDGTEKAFRRLLKAAKQIQMRFAERYAAYIANRAQARLEAAQSRADVRILKAEFRLEVIA